MKTTQAQAVSSLSNLDLSQVVLEGISVSPFCHVTSNLLVKTKHIGTRKIERDCSVLFSYPDRMKICLEYTMRATLQEQSSTDEMLACFKDTASLFLPHRHPDIERVWFEITDKELISAYDSILIDKGQGKFFLRPEQEQGVANHFCVIIKNDKAILDQIRQAVMEDINL